MKSVWRRSETTPRPTAPAGAAEPTKPLKRQRTNPRAEARRLLQAHDEERRRVSLTLHDQVTQTLAALATNVDLIEQSAQLTPRARGILGETRTLARQCFRQVRQLSDELYPLLVAEVGLPLALRCHVAAAAERTHRRIACHITEGPRLPHDMEIALFRLVDDCLDHLHEPWQGTSAVSLTIDGGTIQLAVRAVLPDVAARWRKRFALQFGDAAGVRSAYLLDERLPSRAEPAPGLVVRVPAVVVERR